MQGANGGGTSSWYHGAGRLGGTLSYLVKEQPPTPADNAMSLAVEPVAPSPAPRTPPSRTRCRPGAIRAPQLTSTSSPVLAMNQDPHIGRLTALTNGTAGEAGEPASPPARTRSAAAAVAAGAMCTLGALLDAAVGSARPSTHHRDLAIGQSPSQSNMELGMQATNLTSSQGCRGPPERQLSSGSSSGASDGGGRGFVHDNGLTGHVAAELAEIMLCVYGLGMAGAFKAAGYQQQAGQQAMQQLADAQRRGTVRACHVLGQAR